MSTGYYPNIDGASGAPTWLYWVLGAFTSLLFFASILAHELSHSLVTLAEGGRVEKITLFIFGGVAEIQDEPRSPGREFLMAAAGPGMSLLLAGLFYLGFVLAIEDRGGLVGHRPPRIPGDHQPVRCGLQPASRLSPRRRQGPALDSLGGDR